MTQLIARSAGAIIRIGRSILAKLAVDARLAEAASALSAVQAVLEAKVAQFEAAAKTAQGALAARNEAKRILGAALREFNYLLLNLTGNHHGVDPHQRYFPIGFRELRRLTPLALMDFTRYILSMLQEETNPKIAAGAEPLAIALDAMLAAEETYEVAERARSESFGAVQAEKRNWVRGLKRSRALADASCFFERAYVRAIYAPANSRRRGASPEETPEETPEGSEAPAPAAAPTPETPPIVAA